MVIEDCIARNRFRFWLAPKLPPKWAAIVCPHHFFPGNVWGHYHFRSKCSYCGCSQKDWDRVVEKYRIYRQPKGRTFLGRLFPHYN